MPIKNFFNHTCDIYHIRQKNKSPGYGLPASPSFDYPETADIAAVPCHFGMKGERQTVTQKEPYASYDAQMKLTLSLGVDIRLNDKVVHRETGFEYTAEIPQNVRNHHVFVYLKRTERQARL